MMRPGHGPEAEQEVGALAELGMVAIGAADEESDGPPGLTPGGEALGESGARQGLATLVEGDSIGGLRQGGEEALTFALGQLGGGELALLLDLEDLEIAADALLVLALQLEERPRPHPADGSHDKPHGRIKA